MNEYNALEYKDEIPSFVKSGMNWLDENIPNWDNRIDLDRLDLFSGCDCIGGQLSNDSYSNFYDKYSLGDNQGKLGFNLHNLPNGIFSIDRGMREYLSLLTREWKKQIHMRRINKKALEIPEVQKISIKEAVQ